MQIIIDFFIGNVNLGGAHGYIASFKPIKCIVFFAEMLLFCSSCRAYRLALEQPELKNIDQILVKQSHTAATTFILEAVKHNADKSTIR